MKIDGFFLAMYCLLIFMLSHQSTLPLPLAFPNQDKLVHASAYAVMALLAWRAFRHIIKLPTMLMVVSILFCISYGVSDEFHQSFIEGRNADMWDWFADTIGASIMVFILHRFQYFVPNKLK